MAISGKVALRELRSNRCACGKRKRDTYSLCASCYGRLPRALRDRLYDRIGEGYEAALEESLLHLELDLPKEDDATEMTEGTVQ